jgi:hypothetical protein
VGSNLISFKILNGNGVKTFPGSNPATNLSSFEKKKKKYIQPNGAHRKIFEK